MGKKECNFFVFNCPFKSEGELGEVNCGSMFNCKIVPECESANLGSRCEKINGNLCKTYMFPAAQWHNKQCPLRVDAVKVVGEQKKINPLKASKRSKKKR